MTVAEVKAAAVAKARANGFIVATDEPWSLALQVAKQGLTWNAHLMKTEMPAGYWLHIDDATGKTEFVMPMMKLEQTLPPNNDWLFKIDEALRATSLPAPLETLLRLPALAMAEPSGGGGTADGSAYLEYALRQKLGSPERIEVRFYHRPQTASTETLVVTGTELAYVDDGTYRYRLIRDRD